MRSLSGTFLTFVGLAALACSATDEPPAIDGSGGAIAGNGGAAPAGGNVANGGNPAGTGGATSNGGGNAMGGSTSATGGSSGTQGGNPNTGGAGGSTSASGGAPAGGVTGGGGSSSLGGTGGSGGSNVGGTTSKGGAAGSGGSPATGGRAAGGRGGTGGVATGGTGGTTSVNCSGPALTGGTQRCSSNASGTVGSYTWTIWSSGTGGCITPYGVGAAYKATWNNSGDFLARVGLQWNETQTYDQLGTVSADFAYTKTGTAGGYSFIGIYGWSNNPLVEYYIVEDWYGSGPPTGGGTLKGTFTVDSGTYRVYTHTQTNQPSIHGTATFPQFFSVRQTARQCGHISITEHFRQWASYGMALGRMYEAKILVEAGGGSGSIDFTTGTVTAR